jgi:hypothetical protein
MKYKIIVPYEINIDADEIKGIISTDINVQNIVNQLRIAELKYALKEGE